MITRFNVENKGKVKFTLEERFEIGSACRLGVPYAAAAEATGVSRTYYYELGKKTGAVVEGFTAAGEIAESVILVTDEFIERTVIALYTVCGVSQSNIGYFFENVLMTPISKGKIYYLLQEAEEKAAAHDADIPLDGIRSIASDEVYQGDQAVLTVVDPDSGFVVLTQCAEDRSAETWKAAMERQKERGLNPKVNVSDGAAGLMKGIGDAFAGIEQQSDVFHAVRGLGRAVNSIERTAEGDLAKYCDLEYRAQNPRAHLSTRQEYQKRRLTIDDHLLRADCLRILYVWLLEYLSFTGYGYHDCLDMCGWILDEMKKLYPKSGRLCDEAESLRSNLGDILSFLPRLRRSLTEMARTYHVPEYAFTLMYSQMTLDINSERCQIIEEKLYRIFKGRYLEARESFHQIIRTTCRASSDIENVNGRIRVHMNAERHIPDKQFPLLKMMLNTKKCHRSRRPERMGTSALDRLTGQNTPDFLDALLGKPHYIISAS